MIKAIGIIFNKEKPQAVKIAQELFFWLSRKGIKVYYTPEDAALLERPERGLEEQQLMEAADLMISLGGDGTLLNTARITGASEKPILGVNLGKFGFLVPIEPKDIYESLEKVLAGKCLLDKRMLLKSTLYRNGEAINVAYGLNDVVVSKAGFSRMIRLATYVADEYVNNFPADGIIVSSPTGSTGYSLSAGGPIVSPRLDVIIITPICPHTLYTRPMIVSPEEEVRIVLEEGACGAILTIDGQVDFTMERGDQVVVEESPYRVTLIRFQGRTFYDVVRNKLSKGERNG